MFFLWIFSFKKKKKRKKSTPLQMYHPAVRLGKSFVAYCLYKVSFKIFILFESCCVSSSSNSTRSYTQGTEL